MAKKWVQIRVTEQTHADLTAMVRSLELARQKGQVDLPNVDGEISLSDMIDRLIAHVRNDRRRKRETVVRKRQRTVAQ